MTLVCDSSRWECGDTGQLYDSGDIVLLESTFLLSRLDKSESPEPGIDANDVSRVGIDRWRPPAVDVGRLRGGEVLMGLNFPLIPLLLRVCILEMT